MAKLNPDKCHAINQKNLQAAEKLDKQVFLDKNINADKFKRHLENTYTYHEELEKSLRIIQHYLHTHDATDIVVQGIILKLEEEAKSCTTGFHDRVNSILVMISRPVSIEDFLILIRQGIVESVAHKRTDEVHYHNTFFNHAANILGFGVAPLNGSDANSKEQLYNKDDINALTTAIEENYTPWSILNDLLLNIRTELSTSYRYEGYKSEGYASEIYNNISIFFETTLANEDLSTYDIFKVNEEEYTLQDINWHVIQKKLWEKLIKENYFEFTGKEKQFYEKLLCEDEEDFQDDAELIKELELYRYPYLLKYISKAKQTAVIPLILEAIEQIEDEQLFFKRLACFNDFEGDFLQDKIEAWLAIAIDKKRLSTIQDSQLLIKNIFSSATSSCPNSVEILTKQLTELLNLNYFAHGLIESHQFLNEYNLSHEEYLQLILDGLKSGVLWFKPNSELYTSKACMFIYDKIISTNINKEREQKKEAAEFNENIVETERSNFLDMARRILPSMEPSEEKYFLTLSLSLQLFKHNKMDAHHLLNELGDARQVMYWLLQQYFKENKLGETTENLEGLIIHFHTQSGVHLKDCYGVLEKIKEKGSQKIKIALLPYEELSFEDFYTLSFFTHSADLFFILFILGCILTLPGITILFVVLIPFILPSIASAMLLLGVITIPLLGQILLPFLLGSALLPPAKFILYRLLKSEIAPQAGVAISNVIEFSEAFSPLKAFVLSWRDAFTGYKNSKQLINDLTMPLEGGRHILFGCMGIGSALRHAFHEGWKAGFYNLLYSICHILQGVLQLVTLPLLFAIKMPLRIVASVFSLLTADKPQAPKMAQKALGKLNQERSTESSLLLDTKTIIAQKHKHFTRAQKVHQQAKLENSAEQAVEEKLRWRTLKCAFFSSPSSSNSESNSEEFKEACHVYLAGVSPLNVQAKFKGA